MTKRLYEDTWKALRDRGYCELVLLDELARFRIVRGISKEKNADPLKPITSKIMVELERRSTGLYLKLWLEVVTKTRYTVPL